MKRQGYAMSAAALLLSGISAPQAHAAVTASEALVADDFGTNRRGWQGTDGIGTWTRIPGDGSMIATITNTNPLVAGAGSYVSAYNTNRLVDGVDTPPAAGNYGLRKQINETVLSTSQPYTISFDYRLDSALTTFDTFNDRVHIASAPTAVTGTSVGNTWSVGAVGGGAGYTALQWYFYDQNTPSGSSFSPLNLHMTGVPLVTGVTYSFTITVDPATATYSASITSSAGSADASDLAFRNQVAGGTSSYLVFGGNTSTAGEQIAFSYDNVFAVPEPTSAALLALGAATALIRRRRP